METLISRYAPPTHKNPYDLRINDLDVLLDVVSFEGKEYLSRSFHYTVRFTCATPKWNGRTVGSQEEFQNPRPKPAPLDLDMSMILRRFGRLAIYGAAPKVLPWVENPPKHEPLRELFGIVTSFRRLGGTEEEGQYEITFEPRLALLGKGKQYRLYRNLSVPDIVKQVLTRHGWASRLHYLFEFKREYPPRTQVMQYGESDLEFIERLLAEVGIWYRVHHHSKYGVDMVCFHDWQSHLQFDIELPVLGPDGFGNKGDDAVWNLRTHHQVVENEVFFRTYDHQQADKRLQGTIDQWRIADTLYGEIYEYAMPYTALGTPDPVGYGPESETGHFYAQLTQERALNQRSQLSGSTSSATLIPGQVLTVSGSPPKDFGKNVLVHTLSTSGARNKTFTAEFEGMPYSEYVCFRPALKAKPVITGTIPARVTQETRHDPYSHINRDGRYRVQFLFDREEREDGYESCLVRLARPYAGDTYGLHLPLIAGTEVAIAFEQGDPDRPYIAYALHDSRHVDHVNRDNNRRNVLRTPANNKLRMEDERGREHVKLSTDFAGKSQLNLGHLVDGGRNPRGEGFELRTDHWGALRAGKGLLISTDKQPQAQGDVLAMEPASEQIDQAEQQVHDWRKVSAEHHSLQPDIADLQQLKASATALQDPAILLSAPKGVAAVTPASLLLQSGESTYVQSRGEINLTSARRLFANAEQGMSLLAREEGMRLVSGKGPLEIESHGDLLKLIAQSDIDVQSVQGHVQIIAKNGITLGCGGASIRLTPEGEVLIQSTGLLELKGQHRLLPKAGEHFELPILPISELPGAV